MGRPNSYDHPNNCTCVECVKRRLAPPEFPKRLRERAMKDRARIDAAKRIINRANREARESKRYAPPFWRKIWEVLQEFPIPPRIIFIVLLVTIGILIGILSNCDGNASSPVLIPTPTPTPSPYPTREALPTYTPAPTYAPLPTVMPQPTFTPVPTYTPTPTSPPKPTHTPTPTVKYPGGAPLETAMIEKWILHYTNEERAEAGLEALEHDEAISEIARAHSRNMERIFSHVINGMGPTDRALAAGYDCRFYQEDGSYSYGLSENISKYPRIRQWLLQTVSGGATNRWPDIFMRDSETIARSIVESWMNSPGHRANILDEDSKRIGVGVYVAESDEHGWVSETVFSTQNFSSCSSVS